MRDFVHTLRSIQKRDPAARSLVEIALLYSGLRVLFFHRIAHWLWRHNLKFLGRFVQEIGRLLTLIEIHPGAVIGKRLFIDHGVGVVIGESAEIGDDVTIYHGATLGGIAPDQGEAGKRHPTLKDGAVIGSGAQVLGPVIIGENARVGANAVVIKDVGPGVTVVGIPARAITPHKSVGKDDFAPYGITRSDLPDPTAKVIEGLMAEIESLRARLAALETEEDTVSPPPSVSDSPSADLSPQSKP